MKTTNLTPDPNRQVFEIFICMNLNGKPIYCPVYNWEIKDYSGQYFEQWDREAKDSIEATFNQ